MRGPTSQPLAQDELVVFLLSSCFFLCVGVFFFVRLYAVFFHFCRYPLFSPVLRFLMVPLFCGFGATTPFYFIWSFRPSGLALRVPLPFAVFFFPVPALGFGKFLSRFGFGVS